MRLLTALVHCWIGLRWSSRRLRGALRGGLRASIAHGRRIAGCVRAAGASLVLMLLLLVLVLLVLMLLLVRRGSATRLTARVAGIWRGGRRRERQRWRLEGGGGGWRLWWTLSLFRGRVRGPRASCCRARCAVGFVIVS